MAQQKPALLALLLLLGLASLPARGEPAVNAALLFHNYCSVCHGDRGDGQSRGRESLQPPPRDFTSAASKQELVRQRIIHSIANGRPGTAMVAWKEQLSDKEIGALADYLLTTFIHAKGAQENPRGRAIYAQTCAVCHGDQGDGGAWTSGMALKPRDFTSDQAQGLSRTAMIDTVTKGRPGTPMVAYASQLSKQDIEAVVDYVRTTFMRQKPEIAGLSGTHAHGIPVAAQAPRVTPAAEQADMKLPLPDGLKGDFRRGGDFYMHNCITCHGAGGNGDGPRAYFINPKPANFHLPQFRDRLNRPALFRAISDGKLGTEMPAWGKVLTRQQVADVSEFVFQSFIAPATTAKKKP